MFDYKKKSQMVQTAQTNFNRNLLDITSRENIRFYPNLLKHSGDNLDRNNQRITRNERWQNLYQNMLDRLSDVLRDCMEPVMFFFVFFDAYLKTTMVYDVLAASLKSMIELFSAFSYFFLFIPHITVLNVYTENLSRVYDDYFSKGGQKKPITHRGLTASGCIKSESIGRSKDRVDQKNSGKNEVLNVVAEVSSAVTKIKRTYEMKIETGKITAVFGKNGHGKSLLFNMISGLIPGIDCEHAKNPCFTVYFMQQHDSIMDQDETKEPWSPMQVMALLWPQKIEKFKVEDMTDDNLLPYSDKENNPREVKVSEMKKLVNQNLETLNFEKDGLTTLEDIERGKINTENLSGGQKKKLRLAMYLAMAEVIEPWVFLIDEPYNDLDDVSVKNLKSLISKDSNKFPNSSVFVVTHSDDNNKDLDRYDEVLKIEASEKVKNTNVVYQGGANKYQLQRDSTQDVASMWG